MMTATIHTTGPIGVYAVDAVRHKLTLHTTYVRAADRKQAAEIGYQAHLMIGIRRRHGAFRCLVRGASCAELGMEVVG